MNTRRCASRLGLLICTAILFTGLALWPGMPKAAAQADNPAPPAAPVKLIFIHHSTGENWLKDDDGGLGRALAENNYFVSDTNYGWGPEGIGDRTDIVNWPEWFTGPDSQVYLDALYTESGQHAGYTRLFDDPGGENEVILFKSCFPNSALEGQPGDPPQQSDALTVGGAKYIYNQILAYFASRPDKLFVVVTAPPLSDDTYSANARAFNNWLMQDWLAENDYPYSNVAVFDFYNVLTGQDNHHRFVDGQVEYVNDQGRNTSAYATGWGDDHPNQQGNQKATAEFVPLLNVFYHRWVETRPAAPLAGETAAPAETPVTQVLPGESSLIDDFEGAAPAGTQGWEANRDASTATTIACGPSPDLPSSGSQSLKIEFDVAPESWGTCTLFYTAPTDLSSSSGLRFTYQVSQPAQPFDVDIYSGSSESFGSYYYPVPPDASAAPGWVELVIPWDHFKRVDWEESAGSPLTGAGQVIGVGFGLTGRGSLWIDDLQTVTGDTPVAVEPTAAAAQPDQEPTAAPAGVDDGSAPGSNDSGGASGGICPLSIAMPVGLVLAGFISKKRTAKQSSA